MAAIFFVIVEEVGAQGEYPLADGVCGPIPTGTIITLRSFVARTAPFTQASGSGAEIPEGTSFVVGALICDEGVSFLAVQWDGQQRWLPHFWRSGGSVWGAVVPPTPAPIQIQPGLVGFSAPPADQNWIQILTPRLRIRQCPALSCPVVARAAWQAYLIQLQGEAISADGFTWILVSWGPGLQGWTAAEYTSYAAG